MLVLAFAVFLVVSRVWMGLCSARAACYVNPTAQGFGIEESYTALWQQPNEQDPLEKGSINLLGQSACSYGTG